MLYPVWKTLHIACFYVTENEYNEQGTKLFVFIDQYNVPEVGKVKHDCLLRQHKIDCIEALVS